MSSLARFSHFKFFESLGNRNVIFKAFEFSQSAMIDSSEEFDFSRSLLLYVKKLCEMKIEARNENNGERTYRT